MGMSEPGQPITRAEFTVPQRLQAQYVGHVTDAHRIARRPMPSYPIDNVAPEVVSDRDDGVYVEAEHRNGGYRVHVTIADVAAHIRPGSPLAQAAWQRAFTLYQRRGTDPMFPNGPLERLEEKMSLEHNRERLGLTVSITLDAHFRPIHTSFQPVITHPDNSSYEQAHERMQRDPQFQLMADIAEGVKHSYFDGHSVPLEEIFSRRTLKRVHSAEQLHAMEMVATYMLLANSCTAEFARASELPFLFRNFDEAANDTHATYSTQPVRHTALERMGLKGAYCHFTSPIRRAPDYFNGVMIHYAIDVVDGFGQAIREGFPQLDARKLHRELWQQAPELLALVQDMSMNRATYRVALQRMVADIVREVKPENLTVDERVLRQVAGHLQFPPAPLSRAELQGYADHMNALARSPEVRAVERDNEKYELIRDRVEAASVADKDTMARMSPDKFSSLLQAAAITGDMPRQLFDEAVKRIKDGSFDIVKDGYTVFMQAHHEGVHRWTALKRHVAQILKNDPASVNAMMDTFEKEIAPATVKPVEVKLPGERSADRDEASPIYARIYVFRENNEKAMAAPYPSFGHNERAARSHAAYSFLEHYAFDQLQSAHDLEQKVPNLLYAELEQEGTKRRELVEKMAHEVDATVHFEHERSSSGRYITRIIVEGGEVDPPIYTDAEEATPEEAEHVAIRRMLRDESFKVAVSPNIQGAAVNPQEYLKKMVSEQGGTVDIIPEPRKHGPHQVRIEIEVNGRTFSFEEEAPNLDRAKRAAAVKALDHFNWSLSGTPVRTWATDTPRADREFYVGR